ncbi:MAG TPA: sugar phosphate isomerase/epimerase [Candidatus Scybalocola faecigallinarum]|uniref:Sugar phosphate isomerase/epimerase n=1 Tax=Candidatus Scybalocola faecigallinarum TaxID=2840941 RepID=A0A9D1F602_9FIRM|nr:sugar phosphate isomerase/epimerase [Candidatus Scybalocola faecigallinarum]
MDKIYLQMFSFGEFDPSLTREQICAAGDMGYDGVELFASNFEMPVDEMKALLEEKNLEAISLHTQTGKVEKMIPYAQALGMKYMGIAMEYIPDHESALAFAKTLNTLGKKCSEAGIMLTYHNHTQEFNVFDGEKVIETLIANTDPEFVGFELDAGWCSAAGEDTVAFINKHAGRIKLIHVKETDRVIGPEAPRNPADMKFDENGRPMISEEERRADEEKMKMDCPTGQGINDWNAIKAAADAQGCAAYIVEREYTYKGTRLDCLKEDIAYLRQNVK